MIIYFHIFMGVPGAVLLSQSVRLQIKNKPEFELVSLGSFEFKNVDEPMEVFAVANEGFPVPKRGEMEGKLKAPIADGKTKSPVWTRAALAAAVLLLALAGWMFWQKTANQTADSNNKPEKSIAVLPFKNISAEEENQFFCDGVMESVLNHLSKIEGLKVIARTSMEHYRGSKQSIAEIAKELSVHDILTGSVQRQGSKVRISVQLIEAKTERQIWSDMFDRELTDIFNIQSEIAERIAGHLQIELSPQLKTTFSNRPTANMKAYDFYLQGREQLVKFSADRQDVFYQNARLNFEKALELDSLMAPAYADLASAFWMRNYLGGQFRNADFDTMKIYCEKALSIDQNLPQAHALLGNWYLTKKDEKRFVAEQEMALKINENYAPAYDNLGIYFAFPTRRNSEMGIKLIKKAIELDPFSAWTTGYYNNLALAYVHINAFEEAETYAGKVRESGDFFWWGFLVHIYVSQGKYTEAEVLLIEWSAKSPRALRYLTEIEINYHKNYKKAIEQYKEYEKFYPNELNFRQRFGLAYWLDGQKEKGKELLLLALQEYEKAPWQIEWTCYDVAGVHATLGDTQKALALLQDKNCPLPWGLDHYILIDPLFQNLWDNAEFKEIVRERQAEKAAIRKKIRQAELKG